MKKIVFTILALFMGSLLFSQEKKLSIDLNKEKNKTIIMNFKSNISVLVYPELSRDGCYRIINNKKHLICSDCYSDVDLVEIDFTANKIELKKGIYILEFTSNNDEVEYVKLKIE